MARSVWKGPFVHPSLLKKIDKLKGETGHKKPIKTWSRNSTIIPDFVGVSFMIHNGKSFIPITLILENLRKAILYEDSKPIYQYVINFKINLKSLFQIFSKSFTLYPKDKKKINTLLKEDFMKFMQKENWFSDIKDCNIDKYYQHFIYELENTFNILFEIL